MDIIESLSDIEFSASFIDTFFKKTIIYYSRVGESFVEGYFKKNTSSEDNLAALPFFSYKK